MTPDRTLIATALLTAALSACNTLSGSGGATSPSSPAAARSGASAPITYQAVPDLPFAPGTTIDTDRTLVLGSGERWMGRMALKTNLKSTQAYQYYLDQMPAFGWEPVSAVQGKTSVLTWIRADRAATIEIGSAALGGSAVDITVGPRGKANIGAEKPEKLD
jgi:hypothetical protein